MESRATNFALVDDGDLVAHLLGLLQIVGGEDDGHALRVQFSDVLPQHLAQLDIDARCGFVQHQDTRAVDQRLAQQEPPPHAA